MGALARDLSLDLSRSGLLGAALVLGIGTGVVGAGPLVDRYPRRPLWVFSTGLAAAALLGVSPGMGFERMLAQLVLIGFALGLYDTLVSTLVVERFRERAMRPMSAVHSAATLGAMLGPPLAAWLAAANGWAASFHAAGFAHLALGAAGLVIALPAPNRVAARSAERAATPRRPVFSPALLPFALASFAYVGIESALTVFAVPYATEGHRLSMARGLASISSFWMGLFAGRLDSARASLRPRRPLDRGRRFGRRGRPPDRWRGSRARAGVRRRGARARLRLSARDRAGRPAFPGRARRCDRTDGRRRRVGGLRGALAARRARPKKIVWMRLAPRHVAPGVDHHR